MQAKRRRSLPRSGPVQQQAQLKIEASQILLKTIQMFFWKISSFRPPSCGHDGQAEAVMSLAQSEKRVA
jgi:hypothetical protein